MVSRASKFARLLLTVTKAIQPAGKSVADLVLQLFADFFHDLANDPGALSRTLPFIWPLKLSTIFNSSVLGSNFASVSASVTNSFMP